MYWHTILCEHNDRCLKQKIHTYALRQKPQEVQAPKRMPHFPVADIRKSLSLRKILYSVLEKLFRFFGPPISMPFAIASFVFSF